VALITRCPTGWCAFVDGDDGVGSLVCVDAEYQHVEVSLLVSVDDHDLAPAGRHFFVQAIAALGSSHASGSECSEGRGTYNSQIGQQR
jgi:hypothetical protein